MKEFIYKSDEELPLFLNAEMVAKCAGCCSIHSLQADA